MKTIERILWKLVLIQFIFLLLAQFLLLYTPFAPYVVKVVQYEGVTKNSMTKAVETFDRP
ncbi:hypothetical protein EDD69_101156 [Thermolongibacillus altinsuensis]|jgi:hypothetical protein|uniref:YpfB family protein n=1 Tax=Thermolongibacillus altinsuensis TaxID=575256 RepID=A0A4R1QHU9_9BACL|nr:YpfB family protein [Thermolongibacillus altinsuensis]TCL53149.1 hypothetical protein EDD69_101156 [Thermolongibacillus altinsuensis]GMB07852.1 hypothetical protein B1no1_05620 [Thermolongibacillus altinsuensis]